MAVATKVPQYSAQWTEAGSLWAGPVLKAPSIHQPSTSINTWGVRQGQGVSSSETLGVLSGSCCARWTWRGSPCFANDPRSQPELPEFRSKPGMPGMKLTRPSSRRWRSPIEGRPCAQCSLAIQASTVHGARGPASGCWVPASRCTTTCATVCRLVQLVMRISLAQTATK